MSYDAWKTSPPEVKDPCPRCGERMDVDEYGCECPECGYGVAIDVDSKPGGADYVP